MRAAPAERFLGGARGLTRARAVLAVGLVGLLMFSAYGTLSPAPIRCGLPGAVGCPGGILGPAVVPVAAGEQWFTVTMYDWGFWIVDDTTGANVTNSWNVFEGWTVHVNATSLPPDSAIGGTAYHGLGVELNATGQQLLSLAAPVGKWVQGSFLAPNAVYHRQHIWCTISCGPGHGNQQAWVLNVIPALPLPKATASANVSTGAAPLGVAFTGVASSGTPPYNLTWDFGDGSPLAYGASATHVYTLGGNYSAKFEVTDSKAMVATASVNVLVNSTASLTASLSASPDSGNAPFSTTLSAIAHGGAPPYAYSWSYGDGPNVTGPNLTHHFYSAPGVYAVVVSVHDAAGARARALASVTALPALGSFPVALTANPPNGSAPIVVTLKAAPGGGTAPYHYLWVFGDGTTGTGPNATHQFNTSGSYLVNVFASDALGRVGTAWVNLPILVQPSGGGGDGGNDTVVGPAAAGPAAGALTVFPLASPADGGSPLVVNASASVQGGSGTGETISWNFGDGSTGTGPVVSHRFASVGVYTVTITTTDSLANTGSNSTQVRVEPLSLSVAVDRAQSDAPLNLTAAVTIVGGTGHYGAVVWDWGDATTSTGDLAGHSFPANLTGPVTIHAATTDSSGTPVSGSVTVDVFPLLAATVTVVLPPDAPPPVNVELQLHIAGGSGGYLATPLWTFGDGSSTRVGNATNHSYAKLGSFQVTVQTNDSLGTPVEASAWVNLTNGLPRPVHGGGGGGSPPWSLTGVSDPNRAALILIGLVAASGLALMYRRRSKHPPARAPGASPARASTSPPKPAAAATKPGAGGPPKAAPVRTRGTNPPGEPVR